ncbi:MAG: iphP 1 [Solirubrobacterales bacterium]|nr:iphP 1 [Solirubrobacterales bacterium]
MAAAEGDDERSMIDEALTTLVNLRDVGGLRVAGGRRTRRGVLLRSDAPLADDRAPDVTAWPPRTVIDLRSAGEGADIHPLAAVARIESVPLNTAAGLRRLLDGGPGEGLIPVYREMLAHAGAQFAAIAKLIAGAPAPILVHCAAGKDRTGTLVTVLLAAVGVEPTEIVADYTRTDANMARVLSRARAADLAAGRPDVVTDLVTRRPDLVRAPAEAVEEVLSILADAGGAASWLLANGLSADGLLRLRARLVDDAPVSRRA